MKSIMIEETKKAEYQPTFGIQILQFVKIFILGQIIATFITMIVWAPTLFSQITALLPRFSTEFAENQEVIINSADFTAIFESIPDHVMIIMLVSTIFTTLLTILHCRKKERRSLSSMGLIKKKMVPNYLFGFVAGIILFSITVLIGLLTQAITFGQFNKNIPLLLLFTYLIAFIIQGMSEEVLLRGFFMMSLTNIKPLYIAVLTNSIAFSILHIANPGVTILAVVNIFLFGVFASLYTLYFDNLWGICALHSAWNFVQGNVFGFSVSGLDTANHSTMSFTAKEGFEIIHGGSFGIEGGLAMTIPLTLGILIFITLFMRRRKKAQP